MASFRVVGPGPAGGSLVAALTAAGRELRLLVACRFGQTRLIDNLGAVAG